MRQDIAAPAAKNEVLRSSVRRSPEGLDRAKMGDY